jgi:Domain of unknown function (DUF4132)
VDSYNVSDLLHAFVDEVTKARTLKIDPADFESGKRILALAPDQQTALLIQLVNLQVAGINTGATGETIQLKALVGALFRRKLPFSGGQLEELIDSLSKVRRAGWWEVVGAESIVRAVESMVTAGGPPASLLRALERLAAVLDEQQHEARVRRLSTRVRALIDCQATATGQPSALALGTDEAWTRALGGTLDAMNESTRATWNALLLHCMLARSAKPSTKWIKDARTMVQAIGAESASPIVISVLGEIGKPGKPAHDHVNALGYTPDPTQVHETHSDLLRGLVWCGGLIEDDALASAIGAAADACFKKLPGIGPRAPKIGNACLWALSQASSEAAIAQLSRLKTRAKHASVKTQVAKAFGAAAEQTGLSVADLEEVAVPTCGLTGVGELRRQIGDFTAHLRANSQLTTETVWIRTDGATQAGIPASVKEQFGDELRSLKQTEKEIRQLLPAQRDRLEQLLLQHKSWSMAEFRSRFLDHHLVGVVARRLIWRFMDGARSATSMWHDGRFVTERHAGVDWLRDDTRVWLWHPLHGDVAEVKAWRDWLEAHEVSQPFKQAHRELYLLTEAERTTGIYSNRFAAHLIKQHQFAMLCHQRGWRYTLQGVWDSANTPTIALPQWDLRAEFWVEAIAEGGSPLERGDTTHRGVYTYLSTDQVRFYRTRDVAPIALADVPPLAFSEVMRDVDLFVGVASVGNDPTWTDNGLFGRYRESWDRFAFGDLFPSAITRKAVLEGIVPRLNIADRCSFADRFLVVKGDLRTYKIHLGSGNILMEPNNHYLCIVPGQGIGLKPLGRVFLPFEGDTTLSIIISKALLLADDRSITDPIIVSQIRRR